MYCCCIFIPLKTSPPHVITFLLPISSHHSSQQPTTSPNLSPSQSPSKGPSVPPSSSPSKGPSVSPSKAVSFLLYILCVEYVCIDILKDTLTHDISYCLLSYHYSHHRVLANRLRKLLLIQLTRLRDCRPRR